MKQLSWIFLTTVFCLGFCVCGEQKQEEELENVAQEMQKAGEKLSDRMKEGVDDLSKSLEEMGEKVVDKDVETVDYQKLKSFLPEDFAGMERTRATGEKTKAFGLTITKAEARYESDDRGSLKIEITDMGSLKGITAMASLPWLLSDFERESDSGYERTMTYKGQKGFEKYNYEQRQGEKQLVIQRRLVISISGYQVSEKILQKALEKIAVKKLARLVD
ncbi:hypothetical protein GF407_04605 [candidate division KSB1 bacterium]|nr:hypothetical protein [candidate division KSB1 bacterium]